MSKVVFRDEGLVWFFRKKRSGRFVPAPDPSYPEGFQAGKDAEEVLRDLEAGFFDGNPKGKHYVATECRFVKIKM